MATWNSFPHAQLEPQLEQRDCNTERHAGMGVSATSFQLIWTVNHVNITQSEVHAAWFTCQECYQEMGRLQREISIREPAMRRLT